MLGTVVVSLVTNLFFLVINDYWEEDSKKCNPKCLRKQWPKSKAYGSTPGVPGSNSLSSSELRHVNTDYRQVTAYNMYKFKITIRNLKHARLANNYFIMTQKESLKYFQ